MIRCVPQLKTQRKKVTIVQQYKKKYKRVRGVGKKRMVKWTIYFVYSKFDGENSIVLTPPEKGKLPGPFYIPKNNSYYFFLNI